MVHCGLIDLGFLGLGMAMGRGKSEGWGLYPRSTWFYFTPSSPHLSPHDREIFFPHSRPLGPSENPSYPVKLYYLFIFSLLLQLFLIKKISLIKIYMKLQINLSHQIKLIFSKN